MGHFRLSLPQAARLKGNLPPVRAALGPLLLLLAAIVLIIIGTRFTAPVQRISMADPRAERILVRFHDVERNELDVYRWSNPLAAIFLYGFNGRPALVELRLTAPRPPDIEPATVQLRTSEQTLGSFAIAPGWRNYQVLTPTNPTGDTALVLAVNGFRPGIAADDRELGVALSRIVSEPVAGGQLAPQRMIFLLSLPLIGGLLLWRIGVSDWVTLGVVAVAALGAGWATVNPVAGSYYLPTVWWPWWPLLPLLVGLAWPLLVRRRTTAVPLAPWSGLLLAFGALVALRLGMPVAPGVLLLLAGTLITLAGILPLADQAAPVHVGTNGGAIPFRIEFLTLAAITLVALGLRLYNLDTQPLGLWRDEARHGLLALRIWEDPSFRPVYVVERADLPALLFYLMAPVVGPLGPAVWSVRLVSVLAGALTPLALWWAARPLIGPRAALFAAALIAWASWSLSMSRWAFPATLDHLFVLTAVGLMWRALAPDRSRGWMLAGMGLAALCAGLATYTYHSGRIAPLILAALTIIRIGWSRPAWRRALPGVGLAALVGLATMAPLLTFIASDLEGYNRRVARVSIFNGGDTALNAPAALLLRNVGRYVAMWHVSGEPNGRHHAPGAPMLDPFAGVLLLAGLGIAVAQHRQAGLVALLVWLPLGLVPGLFSGDAPHAMRALGALAPACMLAGLGLATLVRLLSERSRHRLAAPGLAGIVLAGSLAFNGWLYFGSMARDPRVYGEFDVAATAMARVARAPYDAADPALRAVQVFLPADALTEDAVRFLTADVPLRVFDGTQLSSDPGGQALILLSPEASAAEQAAALTALGPGARALAAVPRYPADGAPIFLAYGVGDAAAEVLTAASSSR